MSFFADFVELAAAFCRGFALPCVLGEENEKRVRCYADSAKITYCDTNQYRAMPGTSLRQKAFSLAPYPGMDWFVSQQNVGGIRFYAECVPSFAEGRILVSVRFLFETR